MPAISIQPSYPIFNGLDGHIPGGLTMKLTLRKTNF